MGRIKPAALLRQSKKQKAPARFSVTTIAACNLVIITFLLSVAFIHKHKSKATTTQDEFWMDSSLHRGDGPTQYAVLNTTKGLIILQLYPERAPKAVKNFLTRSENGFYDGGIFDRVIKGFMIQGQPKRGIDDTDGKSHWSSNFSEEASAGPKYEALTFVLVNLGPGQDGSQFFITTVGTSRLNNSTHTVAGGVVRGREVVRDIENSPTDSSDRPLTETLIYNIQFRDSL